MKIRKGFISNSSSSSFIITTTKENYDRAFNELDEYRQKLIKDITLESRYFLGQELKVFGWMSVMDSSPFENAIDINIVDDFVELLKLYGKDKVFEVTLDC